MSEPAAEVLRLKFSGRYADDHEVPALHLIRALEGLQRAACLLALEHEDVEVRARDKVTRDIEETYAIRCSPPARGSVTFDLHLGDPEAHLFAPERVRAVAGQFVQTGRLLAAGDREGLRRILPDSIRRARLIGAMKKILPRRGSGVTLSLLDAAGDTIFDSPSLERTLPKLLAPPRYAEAVQTVTGRLKAIDFERHELSIYYPVTRRELQCIYDVSIEEFLLTKPRDLIQVTGRVELDDHDQPKEILDVQDIREVDLSPFYLARVPLAEGELTFRAPRRFQPELDESEQLYVLIDEELGVDVVAHSRDEVYETLLLDVEVLWRSYALAPDEELAPDAMALKKRLRSLIVEKTDAQG